MELRRRRDVIVAILGIESGPLPAGHPNEQGKNTTSQRHDDKEHHRNGPTSGIVIGVKKIVGASGASQLKSIRNHP